MDDFRYTIERMGAGAIDALNTFSDKELRNQGVVYRKLCGLRFHAAAVIVLNMATEDWACFVFSALADERVSMAS
jgi:hypothetical protein